LTGGSAGSSLRLRFEGSTGSSLGVAAALPLALALGFAAGLTFLGLGLKHRVSQRDPNSYTPSKPFGHVGT